MNKRRKMKKSGKFLLK